MNRSLRSKPAIVVHGGAGGIIARTDRAARRAAMIGAAGRGVEILSCAGSALDAVIAAVTALEDHPLFNAGYGSVLNAAGRVEMDASIMVFPLTTAAPAAVPMRTGAGAVGAVSRVRNPVLLARAVMEKTEHLMIVGAGAEQIARRHGLALCRPERLVTPRAREGLKRKRLRKPGADSSAAYGTVGAVACDRDGRLAAATSTGGTVGKLPGRVGDAALIGAGTFASALGAASATGIGEAIIKMTLCRVVVDALRNASPSLAALRSIGKFDRDASEAGVIVVDRRGIVGWAHNAPCMEIAWSDGDAEVRHARLVRE